MHELPVMKSILDIVLTQAQKHHVLKIRVIHLEVGMLSDLEAEWMQRYFDYLSRGTVAENAELKIRWIPVVFKCQACGTSMEADKKRLQDIVCTVCGNKQMDLIAGREYYIKNMEVE
ncbi:MAG: hydrogenase maturation nickel metallochaperone HypA [Syntrophaceae bacterium]|jgi:hydrogenase nickel incorporation protein HypA/HybF|nr:hydrogenase maturation nickel metallochaperone HypA [Syntrophaceae bacterium]HOC60543.1 hydrogenase maturation nickel metallochaperone HypA [Smithellaceae bacterium]HQM46117.1 hydrogenase maturation nickel metallochaperone HypA [Smithellaceae bacterium]